MLLKETTGDVRPESVILEELPDGRRIVRLTNAAIEKKNEDGSNGGYIYDEVVFDLPEDRADIQNAEDIAKNFEAWWAFGQEEQEEPMGLQEQIDMLAETILALFS